MHTDGEADRGRSTRLLILIKKKVNIKFVINHFYLFILPAEIVFFYRKKEAGTRKISDYIKYIYSDLRNYNIKARMLRISKQIIETKTNLKFEPYKFVAYFSIILLVA